MSDMLHGPRLSPWTRLRLGLARRFSGEKLRQRILRSSILSMTSFGGSQVLRMVSNLVLTRLLFPEAFGLMAMVHVVMTGLSLFSDTGLKVSVVQNKRGDERDFLDTVWTMKVIRGVILWLCACALALPMAALYDEPLLAQMLPVVGLTAIVTGLFPTATFTADRHLRIGRVTAVGLGTQFLVIVVTALLAWWLHSVWALVWGYVAGTLIKLALLRRFLPDSGNRFRWNGETVRELFHFGKWILVATAFTFLINNADKLILGAYISMAGLGIYNLGFMLAATSSSVTSAIKARVLMPLYRMRPPWKNAENRRKCFLVRRLIIAGGVAATTAISAFGIPLVGLLYDDRYAAAGPVVVLVGLSLVPSLIATGANNVMLVAGDSRRSMYLTVLTATAQIVLMFAGIGQFGLGAVIVAPGLAILLTHPLRVYFLRQYGCWDAWGDLALLTLGVAPVAVACWLNWEAIVPLFAPAQ